MQSSRRIGSFRAGALLRPGAVPLVLVALFLLAFGRESGSQSGIFQVVVHASNPASSLSEEEISALFLKKSVTWADGRTAMPVDLPDRSPVRVSFSRAVHGRDVAAVKSYWQRMIFSGAAVPPPERTGDQEVLAFVSQNTGAIGYVGATATLPAGVKRLAVTD